MVKSLRIIGSCALSMMYVAKGSLDMYWENGVSLNGVSGRDRLRAAQTMRLMIIGLAVGRLRESAPSSLFENGARSGDSGALARWRVQ